MQVTDEPVGRKRVNE